MAGLTEREIEILKLRKEGKTQAEIAQKLKISQPAVSSFERNARKKIEDAEELLELLKKMGLLVLALIFLPLLSHTAHALPSVYHTAASVSAGTFDTGHFAFQTSLSVNGTLLFVNSTTGRVGIGLSNPTNTLEVLGTFRVTNSTNGTIFTVRTAPNGTAFVGIGVTSPGNALSVNGSINISGTVNQGSGLDIAEQFGAIEPVEGGDIVAIVDRDNVKKSSEADASLTIGVVSTQPGFTMSKDGLTNPQFIALAGRVPVKIAGPARRGDYIAVSNIPGTGIVASEPSFVVGRALEDSPGGTVYIIVDPGYFSPRVDVSGNLIGGLPTQKFEPPANEKLSATVDSSPPEPLGNETVEEDMVIAAEGKDVVVTLG